MSELTVAFITIFGTVASVSGVVAYVFNGTRKLIKEMHETTSKIPVMLERMDERAEERHREVIELLKKGFGATAS